MKGKLILLIVLSVLLLILCCVAYWGEQIIDFLPIDQSGWKQEAGVYYYLDEDGDPLTGWQTIEGKRYHFESSNGAMSTGRITVDGEIFHLDTSGVMQTGWIGGCYFLPDGPMAVGLHTVAGQVFYFRPDGTPATGWVDIDGVRCRFGASGNPLSGWQKIDGDTYYLDETGVPATGWLELEGCRYYMDADGIMQTGWVDTPEGRFYLGEDGAPLSGWQEIQGTLHYLNEDGTPCSGWLNLEDATYYLNDDGTLYSGWLEEAGKTRYITDAGTLAKGRVEIDGKAFFFTSTGENIVLVNPWNYLPDDYTVELVELESGHKIAAQMQQALEQMLADCEAAGHKPYLYSSYRTQAHQQSLFNNMVQQCDGNRTKAAQIVAIPGTSEHQLGLAVDITDYNFRKLNKDQEKTATQQWLMEHCWDYGFILRYPNEKSAITGIIYEPWHYRYVGLELAAEIKELGLCLEEYLDMLTGDGSTCGGKEVS